MKKHIKAIGLGIVWVVASAPFALQAAPALQKDTPIQISSDKLDVFQDEHKAIFTGNVIAVQGTTNMRSTEMIVFYRDGGSAATPEQASAAPAPQGIYKIEAQGNVVFTTPEEAVMGDKGVYDVEKDTIDVYGRDVTLTRGANILKGTKLNYNMATGRSILTGGVAGETAGGAGKPQRVHGLFVPKSDSKPAGAQ